MNAMSNSGGARLEAVLENNNAVIRVHGRANYILAPDLKQFGARLARTACRRVVLDMHNCESMDSTFIGVLAGLSVRLRKQGGRGYLVNLSPKNFEVLRILGVQRLLECYLEGNLPEELQEFLRHFTVFYPVARSASDQQERTAVMLEAHDDLIRADPGNLMKFKDVVDLLRQERDGGGPPEKK